jgi:hypothetical protein
VTIEIEYNRLNEKIYTVYNEKEQIIIRTTSLKAAREAIKCQKI